jgi:hypothetical protein
VGYLIDRNGKMFAGKTGNENVKIKNVESCNNPKRVRKQNFSSTQSLRPFSSVEPSLAEQTNLGKQTLT